MKYVFTLIDDIPGARKNELLYKPFIAHNPLGQDSSIISAIREKR